MSRMSLRKYLVYRKLDIYEEMLDLQSSLGEDEHAPVKLAVLEGKLREIEGIENICKERGKY